MESNCSNPECKRIRRELEEELRRVKSVGYDMLKQRGGWQSTGRQPTDFSLEFDNFFAHEAEEMIECLQESELPEDEARQLLCSIFQRIYDSCKDRILRRMEQSLRKIFSVSEDEAGEEPEGDEDLYDICRAYGLLLHASGVMGSLEHEDASHEECSALLSGGDLKVPENDLKDFTTKISQISWNLLTAIPPLVSAVPEVTFHKEWHEKEMRPIWDNDLENYELVYYRPVLFMGHEGKVAQKGWVGNKSCPNGKKSIPSQQKASTKKMRRRYEHSRLGIPRSSYGSMQTGSINPTVGSDTHSPHGSQLAAHGWGGDDPGWSTYSSVQEGEMSTQDSKCQEDISSDDPHDNEHQGGDPPSMFWWLSRM